MTQFRFIFATLTVLAFAACSSSLVEPTVESTNKIPPSFKGSWQLVRISCASGDLGTMAEFINANLNSDSSGTKLGLAVSKVQNPDVVSVISSGLGANAGVCSYTVTQQWEKTGHWVQISSPSGVKTGESSPDTCEPKKSDFIASPVYKYMVPVGELSIESKNGLMYLYRTLGRSEKDLEICQTSDRFIYELKKIGE
ncbi:MAG: hypothetical protein B7Y39_01670 [Bdellovibrio sp. 28-41-41]|nr:MAG: hypothetical protein B7Y39_01670 [Bdellovibrio sp. 28-41-41]